MFLASDYLKLHQFTQNAGVRLIFDLNSLLRNEDGSWNSDNAEEMIKFSSDNQLELDWELGNGRWCAYLLVKYNLAKHLEEYSEMFGFWYLHAPGLPNCSGVRVWTKLLLLWISFILFVRCGWIKLLDSTYNILEDSFLNCYFLCNNR